MISECRQISEEFTADLRGENSAQLVYRVHTTQRMSANTVIASAHTASPDAVPRRGYYLGDGVYVLSISAQLEHGGNSKQWLLTVVAGKMPQSENPDNQKENPENGVWNDPLKRKCVWWMERQPEVVVLSEDKQGKPFLNSAGQPFDVQILEERQWPVFCCEKNVATLADIEEISKEANKVNNGMFRGYARDFVLFTGCEASRPQYENGIEFYSVTMRFQARDYSWQERLLNRGFAFKENGVLIAATNTDGSLSVEPVLLDATGGKLADNANPTFVDFFTRFRTDFDELTKDP